MSCLSGNSSILLPGTTYSSCRGRYKGDVETSLSDSYSYFVPGSDVMKFGNLLHIKDAAFLLHSARPALQTGLYKGVIAGKINFFGNTLQQRKSS